MMDNERKQLSCARFSRGSHQPENLPAQMVSPARTERSSGWLIRRQLHC
jgi:hypothetical protein